MQPELPCNRTRNFKTVNETLRKRALSCNAPIHVGMPHRCHEMLLSTAKRPERINARVRTWNSRRPLAIGVIPRDLLGTVETEPRWNERLEPRTTRSTRRNQPWLRLQLGVDERARSWRKGLYGWRKIQLTATKSIDNFNLLVRIIFLFGAKIFKKSSTLKLR